MKQFYAVAFFAQNAHSSRAASGWVCGTNDSEAEGNAMNVCRKRYPKADGYYSHQVSLYHIGQISDDGKTITTNLGERFNFATNNPITH